MEWQRYLQQGRPRGGYGGARPYGVPQRSPYAAKPTYPMRVPPRPPLRAAAPQPPAFRRAPPQTLPARPPASAPYQPRASLPAQVPRGGAVVVRPKNLEELFLFHQKERSLADVCQRYAKLCVSSDFSSLLNVWTPEKPLDIPLNVTVPFVADPELTVPVPEPEPERPETEGRHFARVMLISSAKPEPKVEGNDKKEPVRTHLAKNVKFLVGKKTSGLFAIGGAWSATKDGGDPTTDKALIKTATRHCKEICGVDLSTCKTWTKFMEIHYTRPSGAKDRTVFFIPDLWNHITGDVKVHKQVQRQEQEVEEEVEVEISVDEGADAKKEGDEKKTKKIKKKVTTKKTVDTVVIRSMDLSLNGILEYDLQDKSEETAELSLFAESFNEMLSHKFALRILETLRKKKEDHDRITADQKRKRDADLAERTAKLAAEKEERETKRRKLEEEKKEETERRKKLEEEEKYLTEEQVKERRAKEAEEKKRKEDEERAKREAEAKAAKEAEEKRKKAAEEERERKEAEEKAKPTRTVVESTTTVDEAVLEPFLYFDRPLATGQQSGQLRREKLEEILHGLGDLNQREVNDLLVAAGMPRERPQSVLFYKTLATTTTVTTREVPKEVPAPAPEAAADETKTADGPEPAAAAADDPMEVDKEKADAK
eukprot:RCo041483